MSQKDKKVKVVLLLSIFSLLIIFILGTTISPKNAIADTKQKSPNYFYVSVINNVLSSVKLGNKEKYDSSKSDMENAILSFLGINVSNPISIITKEIPYFDNTASVNDEGNGETKKVLVLNPFVLDDNQVSNLGDTIGGTSISGIYNPKLKQTLNTAKPRVLIYHSHTTESYLASDNDKSTNTFNTNLTQGVCEVGNVIATDLEKKYGIAAINDDTMHNADYVTSYDKSRITLNKYLKKYGNFDIIIDLHRDGIPSNTNEKTKINGVDIAKVLFVMTRDNPRYAAQKKLVSSMIGISNKLYPGLMDYRQVFLYNRGMDFFNQDRSNNAMLIEVGNNYSTIAQVKNTGMYLSRIIAEQLNGKK
jgi:stage II sporulation protein P